MLSMSYQAFLSVQPHGLGNLFRDLRKGKMKDRLRNYFGVCYYENVFRWRVFYALFDIRDNKPLGSKDTMGNKLKLSVQAEGAVD